MTDAQQLNRYSIAVFDWQKALVFANEARKHSPNSTAYEALLFSALVCYCRPFSMNEKNPKAAASSHLEVANLAMLSPEEQTLHDLYKVLRNKALAHSEFAFNPTRLSEATGVFVSKPFSLLAQSLDLDAFVDLVSKLELACHHKRADYVRAQGL